MSTSESGEGVNWHTTRCTSLILWHGLAASADDRLRTNETEISAALWAHELGKDFALYLFSGASIDVETDCR